jgi:hypothetical protein
MHPTSRRCVSKASRASSRLDYWVSATDSVEAERMLKARLIDHEVFGYRSARARPATKTEAAWINFPPNCVMLLAQPKYAVPLPLIDLGSSMLSRQQVKIHINRALRARALEQKLDEIAQTIGKLARYVEDIEKIKE